jgi:hypothetical protein
VKDESLDLAAEFRETKVEAAALGFSRLRYWYFCPHYSPLPICTPSLSLHSPTHLTSPAYLFSVYCSTLEAAQSTGPNAAPNPTLVRVGI